MSISIRSVHPVFVGEVSGIDISRALNHDEVAAIEAGMDRYGVLTFRDQPLTDDQQIEFSRNFGELEVTLAGQMAKPEDRRLGDRLELGDISNLTARNQLRARDDRSRMYALANRLWHSDASFRAVGAGYTLLHGRVIPGKGGNTEFADMRAAYDALDDATKAEVEDLVTEHSIVFSREQIGFADYSPGNEERLRPVQHRLVITHPVSGRKSLYLSYRRHCWLAGAGGARLHPRPDGACDAAAVRLCPRVARERPGDVGQPHSGASCAPLRRHEGGARFASNLDQGHRPHDRAGTGRLTRGLRSAPARQAPWRDPRQDFRPAEHRKTAIDAR
jgi:alpha-ketoglutarate-dependent 2,4-dichlorophenoxyacetate dioxygenase